MSKPYDPRDRFFRKAKAEGLRARSAYKLDEIQKRYRLFKSGDAVLDLGAAPGGFLQIIARIVGPSGLAIGIDLEPIPAIAPNVRTIALDIYADVSRARLLELAGRPFDAVTSDMAPKTTGIRATDEARSLALAQRALELTRLCARPGAHFACKLFMGGETKNYERVVREGFEEVRIVRPEATRQRSFEIYVVGLRMRSRAKV